MVTNSYIYGLDLSGSLQGAGTIGGLLSLTTQQPSNSTTVFYCYDANGNVTDLVGTNGSIAAHYEYDPYGNTVVKTGVLADANPFRFSTKYLDDETSLYYYGHRYYSPETVRWASRDPIAERGGLNIYAFVGNESVTRRDLLGLNGGGSTGGDVGCPGCCGAEEYKKPKKCCLKKPLTIGFVKEIHPATDTLPIQPKHVGILFFMNAEFSDNKYEGDTLCCASCCRFAQQAKAKVVYNGTLQVPPGDDFATYPTWDTVPEEYNTILGPCHSYSSYCNQRGESYTAFNAVDMPGAHPINNGDSLSMQFSFRGYIKDVCNGDIHVGPTRLYGFNANGTEPNITINHWGFN